ncbi:ependymin-like protein [Labeo rohita]|uniref:Ependymin-like protein n=1 Tax=Labeo rohita TaxID=84645 RepID=A0A498LKT6_LABRO|nr:ependymin [Labeo rohita]RXN07314.1 ependymin-like protein [Labeo rohita]
MKILFVIPVCLSLILSSSAQKPEPCKSPPLLEGALTVLVPGHHLRVFEKFSYDAYGQNIRVLAAGKEGNQTFFVDRLLLFREGVNYEIHYHNHTCIKTALKEPFEHLGVPHDAHFLHQMVLGSSSIPGQGLLVNNWNGTAQTTKEPYLLTYTAFGCVPLYILEFTQQGEIDVMTSFFDLVEGIEDPEVFIPPSFCDSVEVLPAKEVAGARSFIDLL